MFAKQGLRHLLARTAEHRIIDLQILRGKDDRSRQLEQSILAPARWHRTLRIHGHNLFKGGPHQLLIVTGLEGFCAQQSRLHLLAFFRGGKEHILDHISDIAMVHGDAWIVFSSSL